MFSIKTTTMAAKLVVAFCAMCVHTCLLELLRWVRVLEDKGVFQHRFQTTLLQEGMKGAEEKKNMKP